MDHENKPENAPARKPVSRLGYLAAIGLISLGAGIFAARFMSSLNSHVVEDAPANGAASLLVIGKFVIPASPQPVPDLSFTSADGTPHRLSEWHGKTVLLNLWATWCAPCKAELPSLNALQAKLGGGDFAVLALSTDKSGPSQPAAFFAQQHIANLAVYNDKTNAAITRLRASGLPVSLILDNSGREIARFVGPAEWDSAEYTRKVRSFISPDSNPKKS